MNTSLYWRAIPRAGKPLSDQMKSALRRLYGEPVHMILDELEVRALEGMVAAGIKDAQVLIDEIKKYGAVEVHEK